MFPVGIPSNFYSGTFFYEARKKSCLGGGGRERKQEKIASLEMDKFAAG